MTSTTYLTGWAATVAQEHLSADLPQRWAHVLGCRRQAERIGPRLLPETERELLVAAALLQDIGYAETLVRSGFHPLDGARFLAGAGAPPRLCNLVAPSFRGCRDRPAARPGRGSGRVPRRADRVV